MKEIIAQTAGKLVEEIFKTIEKVGLSNVGKTAEELLNVVKAGRSEEHTSELQSPMRKSRSVQRGKDGGRAFECCEACDVGACIGCVKRDGRRRSFR